MSYELFIIVAPPICAAVGYFGKYIFDTLLKVKETRKTYKLKYIENKLKKFFYPFHSNLKKETLIFKRILLYFKNTTNDKNENDALYTKMFWALDKEILEIHQENQQLIKNYFVEMYFSPELTKSILKYDEYVDIYRILRKVISKTNNLNNIIWPDNIGTSYPTELINMIEKELVNLQNLQTYILQGNNNDISYKYLKHYQYRKVNNQHVDFNLSEYFCHEEKQDMEENQEVEESQNMDENQEFEDKNMKENQDIEENILRNITPLKF